MAETFYLQLLTGLQYPYKVIASNRAKYIRIKLTQFGELSVTMPVSSKISYAHDFIYSKKSWIEKNLAKVKNPKDKIIPRSLDLKLLNETWSIQYFDTQNVETRIPKLIEQKDSILEIQGSHEQLNDFDIISKVLNNWCKKKAKPIFNSMLQQIAEIHGFHYHRLSIRSQKTRWGSCSNQKNINLNCKLLFMPEDVVRYVMIHELCHTIEMNHSNRFWALVEDCDANYRQHKRTLKSIGHTIVI